MKKFKGTRGKWRANELNVYDEKGFEVVHMSYPIRIKENWDKIANHWGKKKGITCVDVSDKEAIANAQLIATAPELLEALIESNELIQWLLENGDFSSALEHAYNSSANQINDNKELINKALGL